MDSSQAFGLAHLWAQSDAIIRSVGVILLLMSITSWYLILTRALRQLRARRHGDAVERFWQAADLDAGLKLLNESAPDSPFEALAQQGAAAAQHVRRHTHNDTLGATLDADEVITRALRIVEGWLDTYARGVQRRAAAPIPALRHGPGKARQSTGS